MSLILFSPSMWLTRALNNSFLNLLFIFTLCFCSPVINLWYSSLPFLSRSVSMVASLVFFAVSSITLYSGVLLSVSMFVIPRFSIAFLSFFPSTITNKFLFFSCFISSLICSICSCFIVFLMLSYLYFLGFGVFYGFVY